MKALDWRLAVLAMLLGLAVGGRVAWLWQANSYGKSLAEQASDYQAERESAAWAVIDWQEREQAKRGALQERLQANDSIHYKELQDEKRAQVRLRDHLATAELRLSVLLATPAAAGGGSGLPAATSAGGVVHGGPRGELNPAAAQRIVAITEFGDEGMIALKACQAYVREIVQTESD